MKKSRNFTVLLFCLISSIGFAQPLKPLVVKNGATVTLDIKAHSQRDNGATDTNGKYEAAKAFSPIISGLLTLAAAFFTARFLLKRGTLDAQYSFAADIYNFRIRQIEEFYSPAITLVEKSKLLYDRLLWTLSVESSAIKSMGIKTDDFRLINHIHLLKRQSKFEGIIQEIVSTGDELTELIKKKSSLIEGGISQTFIGYQAHHAILKLAMEKAPFDKGLEAQQNHVYYPRMLNREIREGYKIVLQRLQEYTRAGDDIVVNLLNRPKKRNRDRRVQLINTINYYEENAERFAQKYDTFDLSGPASKFISTLPPLPSAISSSMADSLRIMDVGCGTGRDTKNFIERGYAVCAIDASPAMLRKCRQKIRELVRNGSNERVRILAEQSHVIEATFDEISTQNRFDGVWAAASLVHVPKDEIESIIKRLFDCLKGNGSLYMSFKNGSGETEFDGRTFSNFSSREMGKLLKRIPKIQGVDIWLTDSLGKETENNSHLGTWLNVIIRKEA